MTFSDSPWSGLGRGAVDSRRVDHTAKWNFFWTMMAKDEPALALVMEENPVDIGRLPRLRSLEVGFADLSGKPTFYVRLKDRAQLELFETLCRDVTRCAERANNEPDALRLAIGRTTRWHHLLRGGRTEGLAEEEQKGLIGELAVLSRLAGLIAPGAALIAWKGPMGAPKDFELHGHCIEIKSRRAGAQPFVQISNEFQLSDVPNCRLWLVVLAVDRVAEPFGENLHSIVRQAAALFASDSALEAEWEQAISATGYLEQDDYEAFRWVVSPPAWYQIVEGFPRVANPLVPGVANVRYSIALPSCAAFAVESNEAETAISEGYTDG